MEFKYKETEIGTIPSYWEYMTLDELTTKITDGAHKSPKTFVGGRPIATVENMKKNKIDVSSCRRISEQDFYELKRNSCSPEEGDVLLSKDGTIGKTLVYYQNEEIVLLSSIAIIRTNDNKLYPQYLKYFFESSYFYFNLEKFRSGSAIKRIVLKDIKRVSLPIPPLQEQHKIAVILTSIDNAISNAEAIIEQTEKVKKGLLQQLSTRGIGHTKFKQTEIGKIPESWEMKTVNDLAKVIDCKHYTPTYTDTGIPIVRTNDLTPSDLKLGTTKYISVDDYNNLTDKYTPCQGDIIYGREGSFGVASYVSITEKFSIGQRVVVMNPTNINGRFLHLALNSDLVFKQVLDRSLGTTVKRINVKDIKSLIIPFPPFEEQAKITQMMMSVQEKIDNEVKTLEKLTAIKKGLMQVLLTGKIRVKLDDQEAVTT